MQFFNDVSHHAPNPEIIFSRNLYRLELFVGGDKPNTTVCRIEPELFEGELPSIQATT